MTSKTRTTTVAAKLQQIDGEIRRVHSRMFRWANRLDKLIKQRARLEKLAEPVAIETDHLSEPDFQKLASAMADEANARLAAKAKVDDLDVRNQGWLSPSGQVTQAAKDELARIESAKRRDQIAAEAIKAEQAERAKARKKNQAEERKARRAGQTRKMPLTGKAALAAIREAK